MQFSETDLKVADLIKKIYGQMICKKLIATENMISAGDIIESIGIAEIERKIDEQLKDYSLDKDKITELMIFVIDSVRVNLYSQAKFHNTPTPDSIKIKLDKTDKLLSNIADGLEDENAIDTFAENDEEKKYLEIELEAYQAGRNLADLLVEKTSDFTQLQSDNNNQFSEIDFEVIEYIEKFYARKIARVFYNWEDDDRPNLFLDLKFEDFIKTHSELIEKITAKLSQKLDKNRVEYLINYVFNFIKEKIKISENSYLHRANIPNNIKDELTDKRYISLFDIHTRAYITIEMDLKTRFNYVESILNLSDEATKFVVEVLTPAFIAHYYLWDMLYHNRKEDYVGQIRKELKENYRHPVIEELNHFLKIKAQNKEIIAQIEEYFGKDGLEGLFSRFSIPIENIFNAIDMDDIKSYIKIEVDKERLDKLIYKALINISEQVKINNEIFIPNMIELANKFQASNQTDYMQKIEALRIDIANGLKSKEELNSLEFIDKNIIECLLKGIDANTYLDRICKIGQFRPVSNENATAASEIYVKEVKISDEDIEEVFLSAAKQGDIELLEEKLLLLNKPIDEVLDKQCGGNALHWAAVEGRLNIVKKLLSTEELVDNLLDSRSKNNNSTSLMNAVSNGHENVTRYLLDNGADVMATNSQNDNAWTLAGKIQDPSKRENIKQLLQPYFGKVTTANSYPANISDKKLCNNDNYKEKSEFDVKFALAIKGYDPKKNNNLKHIEQILSQGANIETEMVNSGGTNKFTAMYYACRKGYYDLVVMLNRNNADLRTKDSNNNNLLHASILAQENGVQIALFLLGTGKISLNEKNSDDKTPLALAEELGKKTIATEIKTSLPYYISELNKVQNQFGNKIQEQVTQLLTSLDILKQDQLQSKKTYMLLHSLEESVKSVPTSKDLVSFKCKMDLISLLKSFKEEYMDIKFECQNPVASRQRG